MKSMEVCNVPVCELGEGIFWHPERHSFCWFDILNSKFYEQTDDQSTKVIDCPGMASAAARIDSNRLLVAVDDVVISNPADDVSVLNLLGLENMILSFRESASGSANARGVMMACNLLIVSLLLCPLRIKLDTSLIFYIHPIPSLSLELPMLMCLLSSLLPLCWP